MIASAQVGKLGAIFQDPVLPMLQMLLSFNPIERSLLRDEATPMLRWQDTKMTDSFLSCLGILLRTACLIPVDVYKTQLD